MNKRILFLVLILKSFDIFGSLIGFKNLFINFYYNNQNKLGSFYENKVKEHPYITLATGVGLIYGTYKFYNFFNKKPKNEKVIQENFYYKNFFNYYNVPQEITNLSFNGKGPNNNWEKILGKYDYKSDKDLKKKEEDNLEIGFKVCKYIAFVGIVGKENLDKYKEKLDKISRYKKVDLNNLDEEQKKKIVDDLL